MSSPLGEFVSSRFEELWSDSTTRTLEEFMSLALTIRLGTADLATSHAHFVRLDGDCFVDGSSLLDHLTDHGARRLSLAVGGLRDAIFDMVRLDQHDQARRATVVALFDAKYGSAHDHRVILRLVPRVDAGQPLAH
jgi:hypothetical protein